MRRVFAKSKGQVARAATREAKRAEAVKRGSPSLARTSTPHPLRPPFMLSYVPTCVAVSIAARPIFAPTPRQRATGPPSKTASANVARRVRRGAASACCIRIFRRSAGEARKAPMQPDRAPARKLTAIREGPAPPLPTGGMARCNASRRGSYSPRRRAEYVPSRRREGARPREKPESPSAASTPRAVARADTPSPPPRRSSCMRTLTTSMGCVTAPPAMLEMPASASRRGRRSH
jgi:hypothetical protein